MQLKNLTFFKRQSHLLMDEPQIVVLTAGISFNAAFSKKIIQSGYKHCKLATDAKDNDYGTANNLFIFLTNEEVSIRKIKDGTSKTALFAEAVRGDGDVRRVEVPGDWFSISQSNVTADEVRNACNELDVATMIGMAKQVSRSGRNWVWGNYIPTRYNHVMEPNRRSCARSEGRGNLDSRSLFFCN